MRYFLYTLVFYEINIFNFANELQLIINTLDYNYMKKV